MQFGGFAFRPAVIPEKAEIQPHAQHGHQHYLATARAIR